MSGIITVDIPKPEFIQICWSVPDIGTTVKFLTDTLGVKNFPTPELVRAQDLRMTYFGNIVPAEWLTTQTYHGGMYLELVQPLSGHSMFHDYLAKNPDGGIQHHAFRLPVSEFEHTVKNLCDEGFNMISEVDHPIARMAFFDTYKTLGVVTEIMGITPDGWKTLKHMEKSS